MDRDDWGSEYKRLCVAYSRVPDKEQAQLYFAALGHYPVTAVREAVSLEIRESPYWPTAAALAGRARNYLAGHIAPAAMCDVCHGDKFTYSVCEGWHTVDGTPVPVNPRNVCKRDFPHAKHEDAHFCYQCHPAARSRPEPPSPAPVREFTKVGGR